MDSDHFLVAAKARIRLCAYNNTCKSQKIAESFYIHLSELLLDAPTDTDVNMQWQHIAPSLHTEAGEKRVDIVDRRSQLGSTMNVARQQLRRTTHTRPH